MTSRVQGERHASRWRLEEGPVAWGGAIVQMPVQSPFLLDRAGVCAVCEMQETIRQAGDKNPGTKKKERKDCIVTPSTETLEKTEGTPDGDGRTLTCMRLP